MKPPSTWNPEQALEVHQYVDQHPEDSDAVMALREYDAHDAKRAANRRGNVFNPPERAGGILGLRTLLPEALGGIATTHQDPSIDDYKKATGATEVNPVEYDDWTDAQYAKAYDAAVSRGIPISRKPANRAEYEAAGDKAAQDRIVRPIFGSVVAAGRGAAPGLMDAAKGLMSKEDANFMDASEASVPDLVKVPLELLGAAKSRLLGAAGGAIAEGLGAPRSVLGALGKGAATGAALSAGAGAADDLGKLTGSILQDHEPGTKSVGSRIADTGVDSFLRTPGRLAAGGVMGLIPGAANAFRGSLRMPMDPAMATEAQRALEAAEGAEIGRAHV